MKRFLTESEKTELMKEFSKKLDEATDGKIEYKKELKVQGGKVKIFYTPEAYSKTVRLIMSHTGEIAWHCLVRPVEGGYEVYEVLTYPQTVGPAHVNVKMGRKLGDGKPKDPTKYYTDWYNEVVLNMSEEDERNLCGQCHSHVYMGTTPSSTDMAQQKEELEVKGNKGYYLFQIWNKKLEINTYLYDLDKQVLYEKDDVEIVVEDDEFTKASHDMLTEPETTTEIKPAVTPKVETADDWLNYYNGKTWNDRFQSYYNNTYYSPYGKLNIYTVTVEHKDSYIDYTVEAHNENEARKLIEIWGALNIDELIDVFKAENETGEFDWEVTTVEEAKNYRGVIDFYYDELVGIENEFV